MIEFRLLGPLELRHGGSVYTVHSHSQAILLTSLLVSEGHRVPVDALIDELWGGGRPTLAANALQAHMSRLRRMLAALEPGREPGRLTSRPTGYQLEVTDEELDSGSFLREVTALQAATALCAPAELAARARRTLRFWRDPVFGGVVGGRICQAGAASCEEGHYRALELLFEAELAAGNHTAILPELSALAATPSAFRERYSEQLMIALYRSGRQADALELYRRTWDRLANDTRTRPSARLKSYVRAILEHDPQLTRAAANRQGPTERWGRHPAITAH